MGVPGLCYQIQWYMGSGDSDSTPTVKQVLSPLSSSSGLYSFLEALGKTFFLACSRLWGELGSYGCMIGVSISFPPQGRSELLEAAHCFWLMALSIIFRSNVFMCGCMCEGAMAFDPLELKL